MSLRLQPGYEQSRAPHAAIVFNLASALIRYLTSAFELLNAR